MSFQIDDISVVILIVLVGILLTSFVGIFVAIINLRRNRKMSKFVDQFQAALSSTATSMDNGNLSQGAADALATLGKAANITAQAAASMLLAKSMNDQTNMLQQIATGIQTPAPPEMDNNIRTVGEEPQQIGFSGNIAGSQVDDGKIREILQKNSSLKGYFTAAGVDHQGDYDFTKIPPILLEQLVAHYRGKAKGQMATDEERIVYLFLEGVFNRRANPALKAVA